MRTPKGRIQSINGEYIYGHRTGAKENFTPNQSVFGITVPSNKGSLLDRMVERKQYFESIDHAVNQQRQEQGFQNSRSSTHDTGHEMVSCKLVNVPIYVRTTWNGSLDVWGPVIAQQHHCPAWVPLDTSKIGTARGYSGGGAHLLSNSDWEGGNPWPSATDHQGAINRLFQRSIPDNPGSQIGETFVSFLTGDYPKIWTNLVQFQRKIDSAGGLRVVRETAKEAGSSYLNAVFGWIPTVGDILNFVQTLLDMDSLLYGESYRRHRSEPSSSRKGQKDRVDVSGGMTFPFIKTEPSVSYTVGYSNNSGSVSSISSWDRRLSARYAGLARPTSASRGFVERAYDMMRDTGVTYDTLVWDLTPYSWLIDWFLTIGQSIANASAFSPQSGRWNVDYAYVTTFYRVVTEVSFPKTRYTDVGYLKKGVTELSRPKAWGMSLTKHRQRATPFGFGTQLDGLSANQFAILAALGLAKSS